MVEPPPCRHRSPNSSTAVLYGAGKRRIWQTTSMPAAACFTTVQLQMRFRRKMMTIMTNSLYTRIALLNPQSKGCVSLTLDSFPVRPSLVDRDDVFFQDPAAAAKSFQLSAAAIDDKITRFPRHLSFLPSLLATFVHFISPTETAAARRHYIMRLYCPSPSPSSSSSPFVNAT